MKSRTSALRAPVLAYPAMETCTTLFDTHVHLDLLPSQLDPVQEVARANRAGIDRFLIPGVQPRDWHQLLEVANSVPGALAALGTHPVAARQWDRDAARRLETLLTRRKVVALGEIGLDGTSGMPPAEVQEQALRQQIRIAVSAGLPLVLHCRRATGRLLQILHDEAASRVGGIWHGFSGSSETARAAIDLGFGLAFGGPLTWPDARRGPQVLQALPQAWIVLESDAPDLPPAPHRGESNRPCYLRLVAERMAALRQWSLDTTACITTGNALRLLRIRAA